MEWGVWDDDSGTLGMVAAGDVVCVVGNDLCDC